MGHVLRREVFRCQFEDFDFQRCQGVVTGDGAQFFQDLALVRRRREGLKLLGEDADPLSYFFFNHSN